MRNGHLNNFEDFINNVHKLGYSIINSNGMDIPCLYIEDNLYENILKITYYSKPRIDTNLNIYDNGKHVFVDIHIKFLGLYLDIDILLYANDTLNFFESLAKSAMLALAPSNNKITNQVFFIQLTKKEKVETAFELIRSKLRQ